jgi:hypothetical protein
VIVVSGLPRSGTSVMMKMLSAGGVPLLIDGIRAADPDNPEGYYELERVKQLPKGDRAWLDGAGGKAVKIISALLQHLPPEHRYRVIFMRRNIAEVLRSQRAMIARSKGPLKHDDEAQMAALFEKHLRQVEGWLRAQPSFAVLDISYNELLRDPTTQVDRVVRFLERPLDREAMLGVVNPSLYRNRQPA